MMGPCLWQKRIHLSCSLWHAPNQESALQFHRQRCPIYHLPFGGILRTSGIVISYNLTHDNTCVCTSWCPILVKEKSLGCLGSLKFLSRCWWIIRSMMAPARVIHWHGSKILNCNLASFMPCCTTLPKQSKSTIYTFVLVGFGNVRVRTFIYYSRKRTWSIGHSTHPRGFYN